MIEFFELLKPIIETFGMQVDQVVNAVLFIGSARLVFKPLMTAIEHFVKETPSKSDDKLLEEVKQHKIAKMVYFFLDYFASIKIKPKQ